MSIRVATLAAGATAAGRLDGASAFWLQSVSLLVHAEGEDREASKVRYRGGSAVRVCAGIEAVRRPWVATGGI